MEIRDCPVILVHGWKSHPGIWKRFVSLLADASLPVWSFGYDGLNGASLAGLAAALQQFICEMQDETGYEGAIDIVGHCMGTCVARYMLEVPDSEAQSLEVRQLKVLVPQIMDLQSPNCSVIQSTVPAKSGNFPDHFSRTGVIPSPTE